MKANKIVLDGVVPPQAFKTASVLFVTDFPTVWSSTAELLLRDISLI